MKKQKFSQQDLEYGDDLSYQFLMLRNEVATLDKKADRLSKIGSGTILGAGAASLAVTAIAVKKFSDIQAIEEGKRIIKDAFMGISGSALSGALLSVSMLSLSETLRKVSDNKLIEFGALLKVYPSEDGERKSSTDWKSAKPVIQDRRAFINDILHRICEIKIATQQLESDEYVRVGGLDNCVSLDAAEVAIDRHLERNPS
jgi:hypothetical protein